jgi:hypothetical protein
MTVRGEHVGFEALLASKFDRIMSNVAKPHSGMNCAWPFFRVQSVHVVEPIFEVNEVLE